VPDAQGFESVERVLKVDQVHVIRHKVLVDGRSQRQVARSSPNSRRGCMWAIEDESWSFIILRKGIRTTLFPKVDEKARNLLLMQLWDCEFWNGKPSRHPLRKTIYRFDLEQPDVVDWRDGTSFLDSTGLAEHATKKWNRDRIPGPSARPSRASLAR
jgi:hypothetical protein